MKFLRACFSFASVALLVTGCLGAERRDEEQSRATVASLRGEPGEILHSEPLAGAPAGASAFRIVYRSKDMDGRPIPVSGMVIVPAGTAPQGGWQIVAWAHGTTGVATGCAPSLSTQPFAKIMGLTDLLAAGYVVAATDYSGLGEAGPTSYLIGVSEARAVLDSVRAARRLVPGTGSRFAVWGHSQGGHAALFTRQIAASYAPELHLVGVAAGAPPTDLSTLLSDDISEPVGRLVASFTLWSWSHAYGADLSQVVFPMALPRVGVIAGSCTETMGEGFHALFETFPLRRSFLRANFTTIEPWRHLLAANTPTATANGVPLFIAQGTNDRIVRQSVTTAFVQKLCANGVAIHYLVVPGAGHLPSGRIAAPTATRWIQDRFAGRAPPSDCVTR